MMSMSDEKKIIIDEDWKEEAQREKESLAAALEREEHAKHQPPAEASFAVLAVSLATQAAMSLGDMPHPATKKTEVHLGEARFHIDMLEMLQAKTKGNLSAEEAKLLEGLLFDLRMRFVEKSR
jgi:hypothetical protein